MPPPIDPASYESPDGQRPAVTQPIELERRPHDPYAAFRFGGFSLFTAGNLLSITGRQMLAIAVEWELYARTHSATALGLVGLVIAVPVVALSLPAGHLADRFSRKRIILVSQIFSALASAALALVSRDSFANAVTWNNSVFQIGSVAGPAISGLLVAHIGFPFVYVLDALCAFLFFVLVLPIRRSTQSRNQIEKSTWKSLIAGLRF